MEVCDLVLSRRRRWGAFSKCTFHLTWGNSRKVEWDIDFGEGITSSTQSGRPWWLVDSEDEVLEYSKHVAGENVGKARLGSAQTVLENIQGLFLKAFSGFLADLSCWSWLVPLMVLLCIQTALAGNHFLRLFFRLAMRFLRWIMPRSWWTWFCGCFGGSLPIPSIFVLLLTNTNTDTNTSTPFEINS